MENSDEGDFVPWGSIFKATYKDGLDFYLGLFCSFMVMKYLHFCWMFIPAFVFFAITFSDRPNIPVYDSYSAILGTVLDFKNIHGWDCFLMLFEQHGGSEHRLLASRLLYVGYYLVTGNINFTAITFIGDLQLIGIALGGLYFIRRATTKYWIPVGAVWVLFVFDLNTYSNSVIAMQAVANYGVYFLFIAALICFDKGWVWMGAVIQSLTIFSNGNGMLAAVLVAIFTMNGTEWYKVKYAAAPLLFIPIYFIGLHPQPHVLDAGKSVMYLICNTGAPFSFTYALPFGLVVIFLAARYTPWKSIWENKTLFPIICIAAFSIGSMLLEAVFRGAEPGAQYYAGRYLFYPQLLIPITLLLILLRTKKPVITLATSLPVLFVVWCLNCQFSKGMLEIEANRQRERPCYDDPPDITNAQQLAKESCEEGIYCIEDNR